jgi:peptide subunit release factor RF-3
LAEAIDRDGAYHGNDQSRLMSTLTDEIRRRRTFAIISHPDASWPIGMGRDFLGTYDLFADARNGPASASMKPASRAEERAPPVTPAPELPP